MVMEDLCFRLSLFRVQTEQCVAHQEIYLNNVRCLKARGFTCVSYNREVGGDNQIGLVNMVEI